MQLIRSIIFIFIMYFAMLVMGIVGAPFAWYSRDWAYWWIHRYCALTLWLLRVICGVKTEFRGNIPKDDVIIAAKHQSFLDIIMIVSVTPTPSFIMKKQLRWAPILGFYAMRIGCAPVDRGSKGKAVAEMMKGADRDDESQLIIYPQGTRVAPGEYLPYKFGTAILYERTGKPCVPTAANVGLFWPKRGLLRKPGTAIVEFLDPLPAGMDKGDFIQRVEADVEEHSNRLMKEAGFDVHPNT